LLKNLVEVCNSCGQKRILLHQKFLVKLLQQNFCFCEFVAAAVLIVVGGNNGSADETLLVGTQSVAQCVDRCQFGFFFFPPCVSRSKFDGLSQKTLTALVHFFYRAATIPFAWRDFAFTRAATQQGMELENAGGCQGEQWNQVSGPNNLRIAESPIFDAEAHDWKLEFF
jgi:hypothetical protein